MGLALFIKKGCAECHQSINVGGSDYYPFGVVEARYADNMEVRPQDDTGRFRLTFDPDDVYIFGSLRCATLPSHRRIFIPAVFGNWKILWP